MATDNPKQLRVTGAVRVAVTAMVDEALARSAAAEKAGITDHALYCALRKPHVVALRNELLGVLRTSESARVISATAKLAHGAESEHVRMKALEYLGSLDIETAPVQRSEHVHRGDVGLTLPGLRIVILPPREISSGDVIEGAVQDDSLEHARRPRVLHPSMLKRDES